MGTVAPPYGEATGDTLLPNPLTNGFHRNRKDKAKVTERVLPDLEVAKPLAMQCSGMAPTFKFRQGIAQP